jgi:hypothetical protein
MISVFTAGIEAAAGLPAGLQFGMLGAGVVFLIVGGALALIGVRVANSGRAAQADAEARLSAAQSLADDVRRLTEKVEASMASRDAAVEQAFMRHNDACAASMRAQLSPHHDDDDDDHHTKHHAEASFSDHNDNDDHHHTKHDAASLSPHHDDDDDDHKKHHAVDEPTEKRSFFARMFNR